MKIIKTIPTKSGVFTFLSAIVILMISLVFKVEGQTNYYFSSSNGDDSYTRLQAQNLATPWRTTSKLNSFFESISPGDSILFKRGDTFYGSLVVNKSGVAGKPIVLSAYGKGTKPVISGFSEISSWNSLGNNIYEATVPNNRETVKCVVMNGALQSIGRYPKLSASNGGYLNFESHEGDAQITDNQLMDVPNWTGGEIVIRKNHWIIDRTLITSHTGKVINFKPVTTFYKLVDNSGYFIQNHPSTLTQNGDWCYDYGSNKIKIYCTTVPSDVKVSTIDQLVTISSQNFIKFSNISFEGANTKAVDVNSAVSISLDSCNFNFSGTYAASLNQLSGDIQFNNNAISNSLNNAVALKCGSLNESYCTVRNNMITNTGTITGMGESGDGKYNALVIMAPKGAIIEYNTIKNTGYIPLNFNGSNILIKNNVIDRYLLVKQDGAGIYTWNGGNPVKKYTNRVIKGNIVSNGIGNPYGTFDRITGPATGKANGIYMDNNVNNVEILDNTIYNISNKGNHNNSPSLITMKGNTFFNVGCCFDFYRFVNDGTSPVNGGQDITNMNIQNNIFFTTSPEQNAVGYSDRGVNFPKESTIEERISSMGTIDNNYYHLPNELAFSYSFRNNKDSPFISSPPLTFDQWRSFTGFEKNSIIIPALPSYHLDKIISANLYANEQFSQNAVGVKSFALTDNHHLTWDNSNKIDGPGSLKVRWLKPTVKDSLYRSSSSKDNVLLYAPIGPVSSVKNYILRFSTLGTTESGIVSVSFGKNDSPEKNLTLPQLKPFGTLRKEHEFLIKAPASDENASWVIGIFSGSGTTYIDNVEVYEAKVKKFDINKRVRFEVNPTKEDRKIDLEAGYIGVDGTHYTESITLKPFTSKILIQN